MSQNRNPDRVFARGVVPGRAVSGPAEPTPLIGRAREAAVLTEQWAQAAAGHGQTVLLRGEAGIGKSRLVRTLDAHIVGRPHSKLWAQGSEFHGNSAFHPVAALLRAALAIGPGATDAGQLERLRSALAAIGLTDDDVVADVAAVLGIPAGATGTPRRARTRERERQDGLRALVNVVLRLAATQPLLLVMEDLHWVDASTLEFLDQLIDEAGTARILIVLTARPEFGERWSDRPGVSVLPLGRLGRTDVERLIGSIAGGRPVVAAMAAEVARRSGGVPLFVEELTKLMLEGDPHLDRPARSAAVSDAAASGPEDSLVARLQGLPSGGATAQVASVIGQEFPYATLRAIADAEDGILNRDLSELVEAGLLFRSGEPSGVTYSFKHALLQQAAYRMLPERTRRDLHGRLARLLEAEGGAPPELLAHHHAGAGSSARAVRYWEQAGEEAARRLAYVEAIGHLGAAIRALQNLPDGPERRSRELTLRMALGVPLAAARGYAAPEVEECYLRACELSADLDDDARLFPALRGLWNLRLVRAELDRARELGGRLLELAGADRGRLVAAHRAMGVTLFSLGEFKAASDHFRRAIEAYDPALHAALAPEHGADPCVVCLAYLGTTTWALGYSDQALGYVRDSLALARRLGHDLSVAVALTTASRFHQVRGEPRRTHEYASAVIALSEELRLPYWRALGTTLQGWAMARQGNARGGVVAIQRGRKALRETGAALVEPWNLASLADADRLAGEVGTAIGLLEQSLALVRGSGERWWEAEQHRLLGECLLDRGGRDAGTEAEACFVRALDVARGQQAKSLELRAAISLARLLARNGRPDQARDCLTGIVGWFTEGLETGDLREAREALLRLA